MENNANNAGNNYNGESISGAEHGQSCCGHGCAGCGKTKLRSPKEYKRLITALTEFRGR